MTLRKWALAALMTAGAGTAHAGAVLIVNGSSGTSEPDTTASITTQLSNLHTAVGNVVTVVSDIPTDLSGYRQVWDIRFSNVFGLTAPQQNQYLSFLQGGGGMFLMGENSGFQQRNTSIFNFVSLLGGGTIATSNVGSDCGTETVNAPFTGPNPVATINYSASGTVGSRGTGQWISQCSGGTSGSGIAFGVGTLANAQLGALTLIFDVNFMQTSASTAEQNLTKNLIGFIRDQVDPSPVPEPASLALLAAGLAGLGLVRRRRH